MKNADFLDGLRRHEPAAARYLHECYVPSLWRFVYIRVDGDSHLAEDIVSEVVLALIAAIDNDTPIEHPNAWLRAVASRRVQDHFRAAARVRHLMQTKAETQVNELETGCSQERDDERQRREDVRTALAALPEPQRLALEWKYIDRLTVREIASRLDATEKSAESILFRARKRMRDELRKLDRDDLLPIQAIRASAESLGDCSPLNNNTHLSCSASGDTLRLRP